MWEIHMLGLTRRGLETGFWVPRQPSTLLTRRELETGPQGTAPVLDPTCGSAGVRFPCATRLTFDVTLGQLN
jgi:hypothetical protein